LYVLTGISTKTNWVCVITILKPRMESN
jgi:hypothetical protein